MSGPVFSYNLRYIVGFGSVEMVTSRSGLMLGQRRQCFHWTRYIL